MITDKGLISRMYKQLMQVNNIILDFEIEARVQNGKA